jgi:glucose-1-phosphate thymidylyltransferase
MDFKSRKGIILAGGIGTRLFPLTLVTSKQMLPVYDKPMIYYPLTVLMLAGITEVLVIVKPNDISQFKALLGDGSQWGIKIVYKEQPKPEGLAQSFILAEEFLEGCPSVLILGDNIFHSIGLEQNLKAASKKNTGATIFGHHVSDPEHYGVLEFDEDKNIISIEEKPKKPKSNFAITGLYFMDGTAPERAKLVKPSDRGELEITSLLESYKNDNILDVQLLGRGCAWFDTGTHSSLFEASSYIKTMTQRQNLQIGSPDELAYLLGLIELSGLKDRYILFKKSTYGDYLKEVINRSE